MQSFSQEYMLQYKFRSFFNLRPLKIQMNKKIFIAKYIYINSIFKCIYKYITYVLFLMRVRIIHTYKLTTLTCDAPCVMLLKHSREFVCVCLMCVSVYRHSGGRHKNWIDRQLACHHKSRILESIHSTHTHKWFSLRNVCTKARRTHKTKIFFSSS